MRRLGNCRLALRDGKLVEERRERRNQGWSAGTDWFLSRVLHTFSGNKEEQMRNDTKGPTEPDARQEYTPPDVPWAEFSRVLDERDNAQNECEYLRKSVQDLKHWLAAACMVMELAADNKDFWTEQGLGGQAIKNGRAASAHTKRLTTIGRKRIAAIQGRINAKKSSLQTA